MCAMAKVNFENSSVATKSKGISLGNNANKKPGGLRQSSRLDKRTCSEISFKEFLNFLRTAYQINENIESNSTDINIDWNEVATSELVASLMGINQADLCRISQQCKERLEENMAIKCDDNANNLEMSFYPIEKSMSSPFEKNNFNKKDSMADLIANKKLFEGSKSLEHIMKRKLNEVIQEGLLDSVLPYVVPKLGVTAQPLCKKMSNSDSKRLSNNADKNIHNVLSTKDKSTAARRKSSCGEIEVEIHVCDEVKNMKRDFKCSQKLLVSKMGYFAEVTTANSNAGQKLEDMDISVHCDITIFDWLMRWVKKDISNENNPPTLDAGNVVPILVSAAFLQMDPLLEDCLEYCQKNINDIIKASTNLSCLNDNILTRLANMFSNSEVEALRDRKDKIQSRFYCKLIACLAEPNPESSKGHFSSLGGLYQCSRCGKLILRQLANKIPCKANQMKMDTLGNVHNTHIRDLNWSLNDYVRSLKQELRTWRAVYWRLWGDCHYLSCSTCNNLFPTHQAQWCFHHADQPQFFTMEHQRTMTFPIGRYPCCGERAYRFEVLCSESGCQFKEHVPKLSTERDMAIHKIFSSHIKLIAVEPPLLMFPERLTRLVSSRDCLEGGRSGGRELQWWDGLELAPQCPKHSLFSRLWQREHKRKDVVMPATPEITSPHKAPTVMPRLPRKQTSVAADAGEGPVSSDDDSDSSAESDNSEESGHATVRVTTKPRLSEKALQLYAASNGRSGPSQWLSMLSIRNNQDNQREYEERAIYQISSLLTRRTCGDSAIIFQRNNNVRSHANHHNSRWSHHVAPQGGTFVRLEHDWKEAHCHTFNCANARQRLVTSGMSVTRPKLRNRR